jgi:LysR family transcriptional activator of glutamate synthase operon
MDESVEPPLTNGAATGVAALAPSLVALAALGRDANITRAAVSAGMSQPTLSRSLARWETALGTRLFERPGRQIVLTPEGRRLCLAAAEALALLNDAAESAADSSIPSLALGVQGSFGATIAEEAVSSFRAQHSDLQFLHKQAPTDELLDDLAAGQLDMALVAPRPDADFGWLQMGRQALVLVVPARHRLAGRREVHLSELDEEEFISLDQRFHRNTDALYADADFAPKIVMMADNSRTVRDYVGSGFGIAVLPLDTSVNPRVRTIAITSPHATREVGLAWNKRRRLSPTAVAFRQHIELLCEQHPGWSDLLDG